MASTGNVFPTVGASVDRAGSTAWTSPGNVTADDAADASAAVPTDYLVTSGYGFTIPGLATVNGVTVRVEASETGTGTSSYVPQLHSDTTPTLIGAAKGAVTVSGTTKVISSNGGTTDLWSATLTPAIVNAAGFGVSIWSTDTTNTLAIDFVTTAIDFSVVPLTREIDPPISTGFSRRRVISDGFIGPNLLLTTLAVVAATAMCRGPSSVSATERIIADPFDAPNLLLTTLASEQSKPFVLVDPGPAGTRVKVVLTDDAPANILLLSPSPAAQSNERAVAALVIAADVAPSLLQTTLSAAAEELPPGRGLADVDGRGPVLASRGETGPNLLLSTFKLAADMAAAPMLRGASNVTPVARPTNDEFEAPNLLSSTLSAPAAEVPPFRSTEFEARPRARVVAPENQGSLLGLYGITGWGPVIQEITDGRARRPITRIEFEQPPNLLTTTLAVPPQAIPIGQQWFAYRPLPQPVGADVPPNILLTTLAQQPQPLPIGAQSSSTRPLPSPIAADVPPNLLLSTLAPQPYPVSVHNAHWEFERTYEYPASDGSFAGPLLTLGFEPAPSGATPTIKKTLRLGKPNRTLTVKSPDTTLKLSRPKRTEKP